MVSGTNNNLIMKNVVCPLCKKNIVKLLEIVLINDLKDLYYHAYKMNISYLFNTKEIEYLCCTSCSIKFFNPSVTGDEHFYNFLQKTDLYYMDDKEEYDFASKFITLNDHVLDIGCGKGAFSKKIKFNTYTGLELSTNAKKLAEDDGIQIFNQTIQEHSISNNEKYDVVCTFQVLEHVDYSELYTFLKSAVDCLKTNGLLIISVPSADSFVGKLENYALNLPPHHQTHWSDKALEFLTTIFNLTIIEIYHDSLPERLKETYFVNYLRNIMFFNKKLIRNENFIFKIKSKISYNICKILGRNGQNFFIKVFKPYGHSVTIVYKKLN